MSRRIRLLALALATFAPSAAGAGSGVGTQVGEAELAHYVSIPPSGAGLPAGSGTPALGGKVYAEQCAACHGDKLEGIKAMGAPALVGGRGSLATAKPVKTVESYWPYATTLYDYVARAMPFNAPGSLTPAEVYAVSAYVLAKGGIIGDEAVLDATTLPAVRMPNAGGFYDGRGPDLGLYGHAAGN